MDGQWTRILDRYRLLFERMPTSDRYKLNEVGAAVRGFAFGNATGETAERARTVLDALEPQYPEPQGVTTDIESVYAAARTAADAFVEQCPGKAADEQWAEAAFLLDSHESWPAKAFVDWYLPEFKRAVARAYC